MVRNERFFSFFSFEKVKNHTDSQPIRMQMLPSLMKAYRSKYKEDFLAENLIFINSFHFFIIIFSLNANRYFRRSEKAIEHSSK